MLAPVTSVAEQIHRTLGGYVRGQLTANIVLGALYATGLRIVDIRLAVPIGVLTGMLAFVPYIGFSFGLTLALAMALLDWHGLGPVVGVLLVMGSVQILDGMVITPRIVGRSVGLAPLEVLLTMMAAGSLFGFFGVLLAVPLGAVDEDSPPARRESVSRPRTSTGAHEGGHRPRRSSSPSIAPERKRNVP